MCLPRRFPERRSAQYSSKPERYVSKFCESLNCSCNPTRLMSQYGCVFWKRKHGRHSTLQGVRRFIMSLGPGFATNGFGVETKLLLHHLQHGCVCALLAGMTGEGGTKQRYDIKLGLARKQGGSSRLKGAQMLRLKAIREFVM